MSVDLPVLGRPMTATRIGGGTLRLAVERPPLRQDLVPLRVHPRDSQRVLVGLAAAGGEERLGQIARRDLRHESRELGPAFLAEGRRDVAEALGLLLDRADDLRVTVAEVDVDQARGEVEDASLAGV